MGLKIIITGATGMVGEGVLLRCLESVEVEKVLSVSRKPYPLEHPKLEHCIVPDFFELEAASHQLSGYDACFFCAGVSSLGKNEADYTRITYDTTMHFARKVLALNSYMTFIYVSGAGTDSSEKGKLMWARVKGKTENDLMRLPFKRVYNFRPGFMKDMKGQKNVRPVFKAMLVIFPVVKALAPNIASTLAQVGTAMINAVTKGYPKNVLEVSDINKLSES
jgi:uncharacterized protein YbjT (DUF2867 family)